MKEYKKIQYVPPTIKRKIEEVGGGHVSNNKKSKKFNKNQKKEEQFDLINQSLKDLGLDLTL